MPVAEHARLWSPPGSDPPQPLPLLVVHDGTEYERAGGLTRLVAHAIAGGRLPPCRVALLDAPDRAEAYSASARHARALAALLPRLAPASARAGMGASLGALAMLHAHRLHPRCFAALFLQSGSYFTPRHDRHEAGFRALRADRPLRRHRAARGARRDADPDHADLRRGGGEPRRQPRGGGGAAAPGPRRRASWSNRDAHNMTAWRDTLDPHLVDLLARAWQAKV